MLGLGVWGIVDDSLTQLVKNDATMQAGLYVMIIAGAVIVLTSIFGCLAIKKQKKKFVIIYCVVALVAIFLKIVGCILVFDYFVTRHEYLQVSYKERYGVNGNVTFIWDEIQTTGQCCGLLNYRDWEESYYYLNNGRRYPLSCCKVEKLEYDGGKFGCEQGKAGYIFAQGCDGFIKKYYYGIGGAAVVIILIELFAVVMVACLYQYFP